MSKPKARRVDYYPDEYVAGVAGVLTAAQQGVYWMVCTLVMSEGGSINQDDRRLGGLLRMRPADVRNTIDQLVEAGKLQRQSDGKLSQKRAQSEVEKSLNRIQIASENGANGGRPAKKDQSNQGRVKANGFGDEKTNHQPPTTNHQPKEKKEDDKSSSEDGFEEFYRAYPRRAGKGAARKAYGKAIRQIGPAELLAATRRYAKAVVGVDPKFIPHPSTWLNGERWGDEPGGSGERPQDDDWSRREAEIYASLR